MGLHMQYLFYGHALAPKRTLAGAGSLLPPCGSQRSLAISAFGGWALSQARPGAFTFLRLTVGFWCSGVCVCQLKHTSWYLSTNTLDWGGSLTSQIWERTSPLLPDTPHFPYHLIRTDKWIIHLSLPYWDHNHWAGRCLISVDCQYTVRN